MTLEQRFWAKVRVGAHDECWEWQASKHYGGYGFLYNDGNDMAHRVSWKIHNGPIPDGMFVCHKCDNPGCVNPGHLFLGAMKDNIADRVAKGRSCSGESQPSAKLTWDAVRQIRENAEGLVQVELAALFGVSQSIISQVQAGKRWRA